MDDKTKRQIIVNAITAAYRSESVRNALVDKIVANVRTDSVFERTVAVENMGQVMPRIKVSDSKLQAKLDKCYIGCYPKEWEEPHVTIPVHANKLLFF